jgi:catechol 2,3-dioxygenase
MTQLPNAQLTHMGLYVQDMELMTGFYTSMFGLICVDQGDFQGRSLAFLSRSAEEHHQIVMVKGRTAGPEVKILGQISFRVDSLNELRFYWHHAEKHNVRALEGRNHGNSWSLYFFDPEGNFVEMYVPTPWAISQPWRVALDLSLTNDEIEKETLALLSKEPSFRPAIEWETEMKARIASGLAPSTESYDPTANKPTANNQTANKPANNEPESNK